MNSTEGRLLVAMPEMGDDNFDRTVLWMLSHDTDGAVGVVLNRPSELPVAMHLADLAPFVSPPDVLFIGGPVSNEIVIGIGDSDDGIAAVDLLALAESAAARPPGRLRLFAGYAGWSPGQLEGEMALDGWVVVDGEPADVFSDEPEHLWRRVLGRQGGSLARLARFPESPALN